MDELKLAPRAEDIPLLHKLAVHEFMTHASPFVAEIVKLQALLPVTLVQETGEVRYGEGERWAWVHKHIATLEEIVQRIRRNAFESRGLALPE